MKPVIFNPVAIADLDEITNYIGQHNVSAADEVRDSLLQTAERIGQQPGIGIRPMFSSPRFEGIRFIPADDYPNHLLFYQEEKEKVEVLRILHGARNLPPLFE